MMVSLAAPGNRATTSNVANLQTLNETATKMDGLLGMSGNRFFKSQRFPRTPSKEGLVPLVISTRVIYRCKEVAFFYNVITKDEYSTRELSRKTSLPDFFKKRSMSKNILAFFKIFSFLKTGRDSLTVAEEMDILKFTPMARQKGTYNKVTQERISNSEKVDPSLVHELFDFWKTTFSIKRAALDLDRYRNLGNAIFLYGMEDCRRAILGCAASEFHMGKNKHNKVYNGIDLIFRDASHIERFIGYLEEKENREKPRKEDW